MLTIKKLIILLLMALLHFNPLNAQTYKFENDSLVQELNIIKSNVTGQVNSPPKMVKSPR